MMRGNDRLRDLKMRTLLAILMCFALAMAAGCAKKSEAEPPIKIGLNVWPGYGPIFIAAQKGLFKKNGVDVELVLTPGQNASLKVYEKGDVDGVFTTMPDMILLNSRGKPATVVYVTDFSMTGDVIIGRPEFKTMADLKGQRLSFEGTNTFSNIFVLKALGQAGLKEYDVTFQSVPAHQVLARLEDGSIAAGHTWEPTKSEALNKGYKILAEAKNIPGVIIDVLTFNPEIIHRRPEAIKAIVKSLLEAQEYVDSHRGESLELMAKAFQMGTEEMRKGLEGIDQPDLDGNVEAMKIAEGSRSLHSSWQTVLRFYFERGQLRNIPDFKSAVDPSFVNELKAAKARARHL